MWSGEHQCVSMVLHAHLYGIMSYGILQWKAVPYLNGAWYDFFG
jgi:hypothetical protein